MINLGRFFVTGGGLEKSADNSLNEEDRGGFKCVMWLPLKTPAIGVSCCYAPA